ncbi:uncharacterized protein LOC112601603 [Melanaphis sacchari]|uniref:uncharacterized protein LOC112601603 n=1 Tax=Melanaphis sacchari TaxID=742174 RepID=UPI000DC151E8|nr:uncharacterized protein LOC112601603 [Melanaphis sacchari]
MIQENTKNYITNLQLMKLIGLYQLLNPNATTLFGYSIYKLGGLWIFSPIITKDNYLYIKSKNSTYIQYRYNILNLIFPVSTQFYNDNFNVFYLIEVITLSVYGYSMIIFDFLFISYCITIAFQLKTIASSYSSLGYNLTNNNKIKIVSCISNGDYQSSTTNSKKGVPLTSPESIKFISTAVFNTGHLFLACYLFSLINKYNDTINFALYNCNWIEMNINFKKLLLFTMKMNNANNFKLNISPKIMVNLKLFTNVIHTSYKIIPVLKSIVT